MVQQQEDARLLAELSSHLLVGAVTTADHTRSIVCCSRMFGLSILCQCARE